MVAIAILTGLVILSRRDPVSADNVVEPRAARARQRPPRGGRDVIFATLSDYVDLAPRWWKIGLVVLLVSVLVPGRVLRCDRR